MPIGELCNREVVIAHLNDTAAKAAQLMRKHHVGDVLVVSQSNGHSLPVGIVTDRDLVVQTMACQINPEELMLKDMVVAELVTINQEKGVFEAIRLMRVNGVRRLPVVDADGSLVGIVTMNDFLQLLIAELHQLVNLIPDQQQNERIHRP